MPTYETPSLSIDASVNASQKASTVNATVTHSAYTAGARLEFWRDNVRVRTQSVDAGSSTTILDLTGSDWGADGPHSFKVRIYEAGATVAGDWSAASTVLVDTRAPGKPTVVSVAVDNKINATEAADQVAVAISHEAATAGSVLEILVDGNVVETVDMTVGARSTTVNLAGGAFGNDGSHAVTARMTDAVGNVGLDSPARSVVVATTVPDAPILGSLAGDNKVSAAERLSVYSTTIQHGEAASGSKLELWRDGVLLKSLNVASGSSQTTLSLSGSDWGSTNGEHQFKVRIVDSTGNASDWSSVQHVLLDTIAPTAVSLSAIAQDGFVNADEVSDAAFTITHERATGGSLLEIYRDGALLKTVPADDDATSTTIHLTGAEWGGDGSHTIRARLTDDAGNTGAWSATVNYTVDTIAASAPTLSTIAKDDIVNAAEKAARISVVVSHEATAKGAVLELARDGDVIKTVVFTGRATSTTLSLTGNDWGTDGNHDFTVRLTDASGNVGDWSAARAVLVASEAPTAVQLGTVAGDNKVNALEKTDTTILSLAHATADSGSTIELYRDSVLLRRVVLEAGQTATDIQFTGADWGGDGVHLFKARMIDGFGNVGAFGTDASVLVDSRPPAAPTLPKISTDNVISVAEKSGNTSFVVGFETAQTGAELQIYRNDTLWKTVNPTAGSSSATITVAGSEWGDAGVYAIKVRLVDAAGNVGAWSQEQSVAVAGQPAQAVHIQALAGDGIVNAVEKAAATSLTIEHDAATAGARIELYRDGVMVKSIIVEAGATSSQVSLSGTAWGADGDRVFKARMVDGAGTAGAWSENLVVKVDTVGPNAVNLPVIATDDKINAAELAATTLVPVTHEAGTAGAVLEVYVDGTLLKTVTVAAGATATNIPMTGGDWGIDGTHAVKVRMVDGAGNPGAFGMEKRILVDTVANAAPVLGVMAGDDIVSAAEKAGARTVTITHEAATSGTKLNIYRDNVLLKTLSVATGAISTTASLYSADWGVDGQHAFTATLVDLAGNESQSSEVRAVRVMSGLPGAPTMPTLAGDDKVNAQEQTDGVSIAVGHAALSDDATLEIYRDGVRIKSVAIGAGATSTDISLAGADWGVDGSHSFKARIVDIAGNAGAFSAEKRVTVDTVAPVSAILPVFAGDDKVNALEKASATTIRVSHESATAGATIELWRDDVLVKTVNATSGARLTAVVLTGDDWGDEGDHVITARLIDGAGNVGAWSEGRTVSVAAVAPASVAIDTIADDDTVNIAEKAGTIILTLSHDAAQAGSKIELYRDGRLLKTVSPVQGAGQTSVNMMSADWSTDGTHAFTARMIDGAGNPGGFGAARSVLIDSKAPTATSIQTVGVNNRLMVANDTPIVVRHELASVGSKLELYRGETLFKTIDVTSGASQTSVAMTAEEWGADGAYQFKARLLDGAGNVGAYGVVLTVSVGTDLALAPLSGGTVTLDEQSGLTTLVATHVSLASGWTLGIYRDDTLVKTVNVAAGATSTTTTLTGSDWGTAGSHEFKVKLFSAQNVNGMWSAPQSVTVADETIAAPTLDTVIAGDDVVNAAEKAGAISVTIHHETAGSGWVAKLYRGDTEIASRNVTAGDVSTSFTVTGSAWGSTDGDITLKAKIVRDSYSSDFSATRTVHVDATIPTAVTIPMLVTATQIPDEIKDLDSEVTILHAAAEAGSRLAIYRDGTLVKTIALVVGATSTDMTISGSDWGANGTRIFSARVIDSAGNEGVLSVNYPVTVGDVQTVVIAAPQFESAIAFDNIINAAEKAANTAITIVHDAAAAGWTIKLYRGTTMLTSTTATVGSTSTTMTITGTDWGSSNGNITLRAKISSSVVDSDWSDPRVIVVDTTGPATPTLGAIAGDDHVTAAEAKSATSFTVTHEALEAGSVVELYRNGTRVFTKYDTVAGSTSTTITLGATVGGAIWDNFNLTQNISDAFTVKIADAAGNRSAASAVHTVAIDKPTSTALDIATGAIKNTSALLMWDPVTAAGTVTYNVYNGATKIATVSGAGYQATGLTANTDYSFTVKVAVNGTESGTTDTIAIKTASTARWDISQVYSPYIDMGLAKSYDIVQTAQQAGLKAISLGFLVLKPIEDLNGKPTGATDGLRWGEGAATKFPDDMLSSTLSVKSAIAQLQANGVDVTIALGGFSGNEPALYIHDVAALTAMYQSIIDTYGIKHLDVDIEGRSLNAIGGYNGIYTQDYLDATHHVRNLALKALKEANPGISISFTIPVVPSGMPANVLSLMEMVKSDGFDLDTVNIMAMDYGSAWASSGDQGRNAVDAARNTVSQLRELGLSSKVGVTPMIGVNDVVTEIFTQADANELVAYARDNPDIASIGIWSIGRDDATAAGDMGKATTGSSGTTQAKYDYSNALNVITDAGAGYDTVAGLTIINTMAGNDMVNVGEVAATSNVIVNHAAAAAGSSLQLIRDGVLVKTVATTAGTTATTISLSGADWGIEGAHVFTVKVIDSASNVLSTSANHKVTVDLTAPVMPQIPSQAGNNIVGPAEAANGLKFTFDHDAVAAGTRARIYRDNTLIKTVTLAAGATHSSVVLYGEEWGTPGTGGTHTYAVQLVDLAGNASLMDNSRSIIVDKYATVKPWSSTLNYPGAGNYVSYNGKVYKSGWYASAGEEPGKEAVWTVQGDLGQEESNTSTPTPTPNTVSLDPLAFGIGTETAMLSWQQPAASGTKLFKIYKDDALVTETSNLKVQLTGLTSNTDYDIRVDAYVNGTLSGSGAVALHTEILTPWNIGQVYSPYIDMGLVASNDIVATAQTAGLKAITLGFLVMPTIYQRDANGAIVRNADWSPVEIMGADGKPQSTGELRWGEGASTKFPNDMLGETSTSIKTAISQLKANGVQVTIALGGFSGNEPALYTSDVAKLTAIYQSLIDTYGINHLDIDIEGRALNAVGGYNGIYSQGYLDATHHARNLALKAIKAANPGVEISFTLPVTPEGLPANAVAMLTQVHDDGLDLDVVNLMTMDYGAAWSAHVDQGRNAIDAARHTITQIRTIGLDAKVGITPMIGINDVTTEIFTQEDAAEVVAYAKDNPDIASIGIWSLGRDAPGLAGQVTVNGSGISQNALDFTHSFNTISDAGDGYNTASGITIVNSIAGDDFVNIGEKSSGSNFVVNHNVAATGSKLQILRDGTLVKTVNLATGATATTVSMSGADWGADGQHEITARVVSATNVQGSISEARKFIVDTVAPGTGTIGVVSGDNAIVGGEASNGLTFGVDHAAAAVGTKMEVYHGATKIKTITLVAGATHTDFALYGTDVGIAGIASTESYSVKLVDIAGNAGSVSATRSVSIDKYATVGQWSSTTDYKSAGLYVLYEGFVYKSNYWTTIGKTPDSVADWTNLGPLSTANTVPNAPKDLLAAHITTNSMFLMWDAATVPGTGTVSGYDVYRDGVKVASVTNTQYSATGLTADHDYTWTIVAKDEFGSSAQSAGYLTHTRLTTAADIHQVYSPYADLSLTALWKDPASMVDVADLTAATLGYVHEGAAVTDSGATYKAYWPNGGPIIRNTNLAHANELASGTEASVYFAGMGLGNNLTISIGGGYNTDPTMGLNQNQYVGLLDRIATITQSTSFDFAFTGNDLNSFQSKLGSHQALDKSIAAADTFYGADIYGGGGLTISFTLPVMPAGLTDAGKALLTEAHNQGVHIDVVNIMAMDYWQMPASTDMGRAAVDAAINTLAQLDAMGYTDTQVGIYVKGGYNSGGQVFSLADATQVYEYAKENPDVARVGLWMLSADSPGTVGTWSNTGSGIPQAAFAFSNIFGQI